MYPFVYHKATSVEDARKAFADADDAAFLAGGMTLVPTMKQRLAMPSDLVDLNAIASMRGVTVDGDILTIGAMTTHHQVATSSIVQKFAPGLAGLAGTIGDRAVRYRGTLGGSIANNDPAADYPGAVLALSATIVTDRREIAGDDFFTGMFETALDEGELITAVRFAKPIKGAYAKFPNPASRYAIAGVFVAELGDGVRVAVTGAAPTVFRVPAMESALARNFSPEALEGIGVDEQDLNTDIHASAAYRAHLVSVMAGRAVHAALEEGSQSGV